LLQLDNRLNARKKSPHKSVQEGMTT